MTYSSVWVETVCKKYLSGMTQQEIATALGMSAPTVNKMLKASGFSTWKTRRVEVEDVRSLRDRGMTQQEISQALDVSVVRVRQVMRSNGISTLSGTAMPDGQPRQCSYCGLEYPATGEYFKWDSSAHTSLSRMCKKCNREQSRENVRQSRLRHSENDRPYQLKLKVERAARLAERQAKRQVQQAEQAQIKQERQEQNQAEREASRLVKEQKRIFAHTCIDCGLVDFSRSRSRRHKDGFRCATCGAVYNKKAKAERKADYYAAHPDRKNAEKRRWEDTHPVEHHAQRIAHDSKRRARSFGLTAEYHLTDYGKMLDYWCNSCAYCGGLPGRFDEHQTFHSEHFIPLSPGYDLAIANPGTVPGNMLPACAKCNLDKRNQDPYLWTAKRFGRKRSAKILARIETYFAQFK